MKRLALLATLALAACDKPAPAPAPGAPGGSTAAAAPKTSSAPGWAATRVAIPVAERTLKEHLDLLDASSPFKKPDQSGFWAFSLDGERRFTWGGTGNFWEVFLDLCDKGRFRFDHIGDSISLQPGRLKWRGARAEGPALIGIDEIKMNGADVEFRLNVAFEPKVGPEMTKEPKVKIGGKPVSPTGTYGGFKTFGWMYKVPSGTPGPLEAAFVFERAVEFAEVEVPLAAGTEVKGPEGKGTIRIEAAGAEDVKDWEGKTVKAFLVKTKERGIEQEDRWLRAPDGTILKASSWQSMSFGGPKDTEMQFKETPPAGSVYVVKVRTKTENVKFDARFEKLDWAAWSKDVASLQGRIAWPKPPSGKTEVRSGISRPDGKQRESAVVSVDLEKLARGGDEAANERVWWNGVVSMGVLEDDKFPSFRAEILDEGDWLAWVQVGAWVEARIVTVTAAGVRFDVAIDPQRAASVKGTAPANGTVRFQPCDKSGAVLPVIDVDLGPLARVKAGADGAFAIDGLRPGKYRVTCGSKSIDVEFKAGETTIDVK